MSEDALKIEVGMYFRDKDDNVYRIIEMGKPGKIQGKHVSKRDRNGNSISYHESRLYRTFYVYDWNAYCSKYCYDEFDVMETHERIIDCLYPDDIIIAHEDGKCYRVINRIKNKKYDFVECMGNGFVKCLRDEEILKKLNTNLPDRAMATIKKGDRIRHIIYGWVTVEETWGDRLTVRNQRTTFKMFRKDVKDIRR